MTPPFGRLLIANRGEIVVRVVRACQEMGIHTVAVFSEADRGALHTRIADEAHFIGSASPAESYLNVERVLSIARQTDAEAIHPGYGFLSENAELAEACAREGVAFVGPSPTAMRLLGDKAAARRLAAHHRVPVVPGYDGEDQSPEALLEAAAKIGFPLLIKAATGGGGRGMRVVRSAPEFQDALESARHESEAAFGEGTMILERLIAPARHVEVQVLGDQHGAMVHLGERDCSVQRRHQKVIEESPSPVATPELRARLGEAAVKVARAAGYHSAGTCEFLVDESGAFYFIEMNARLQVEHPVTEAVTGMDIVRRQIEIAAGAPLNVRQQDVAPRGHAIELRIYAEDPWRDFLPAAGRLERFEPANGPGLRNDVGFSSGDVVDTFYDAMLGKLIVWAEDRPRSLARARSALERYVAVGVTTNLTLLRWTVAHPTFRAGLATTDFLEREWRPASAEPAPPEALAAAAGFELTDSDRRFDLDRGSNAVYPWQALGAWRISGVGVPIALETGQSASILLCHRATRAGRHDAGRWRVDVADAVFAAHASADGVTVERDGVSYQFRVERVASELWISNPLGTARYAVRLAGPPRLDGPTIQQASDQGGSTLRSPMPGRVVRVAVREGEAVREHQTLVVLEAMKIEHAVATSGAGVVRAVHCKPGDAVEACAVLVDLDA